MPRRFEGKVVIVTGSSAGIGQDAAVAFGKEGAKVVIHGQNVDRLTKTASMLLEAGVPTKNVLKVVGSMEDPNTPAEIVKQTVDKFGQIDVLINNAGAGIKPNHYDNDSMENLDFLYNVNLKSVVLLTQLAIPYLEKTRGNVVNVSSISSTKVQSSQTFYNMLKAALDHFTRCYADKYGPKGIRVNSLNPGFVRTLIVERKNLGATAQQQFEQYAADYSPLGRVGLPSEMSTILKFLASDEASFVTGVNWIADGGHTLYTPPLDFS